MRAKITAFPKGFATESGHCLKCNSPLSVLGDFGQGIVYVPCQTCYPELWAQMGEIYKGMKRARRIEHLKLQSGIPLLYEGKSLDSYMVGNDKKKSQVLAACRSYVTKWDSARERGTNLILIGPSGTGKGHLAAGIGAAIIERSLSDVVFVNCLTFFREIKATFDGEGSETEIMDRLIGADLLILDDLGVQWGSKNEELYLYALINGRYERKAPIIATTNLSIQELSDALGERIIDRLRSVESNNSWIACAWESYRQGGASDRP